MEMTADQIAFEILRVVAFMVAPVSLLFSLYQRLRILQADTERYIEHLG
jgi:hypothetical protein